MGLRSGLATIGVMALACGTNASKVPDMDWVYAAIRPPMVVRDGTEVNVYERWWEDTEDCLELRYDFNKVLWAVVRTDSTFSMNGLPGHRGYTIGQPRGRVLIMLAQPDWLNAEVVRHESVHAITGRPHGELPETTFIKCSLVGGT